MYFPGRMRTLETKKLNKSSEIPPEPQKNEGQNMKKKQIYDPQKKVDEWNNKHPVGTKVIVTKDDGKKIHTTTTAPCSVMCGTIVIWLKDISGCYELERVVPDVQ